MRNHYQRRTHRPEEEFVFGRHRVAHARADQRVEPVDGTRAREGVNPGELQVADVDLWVTLSERSASWFHSVRSLSVNVSGTFRDRRLRKKNLTLSSSIPPAFAGDLLSKRAGCGDENTDAGD